MTIHTEKSYRVVIFALAFVMIQSCSSKSPHETRINLEKFNFQNPAKADCGKQDNILSTANALLLKGDYGQALHLASIVISHPCSQNHYKKALKLAGDAFLKRGETIQAFYYYLEILDNETEALNSSPVLEKIVSITGKMNPEAIIRMTSTMDKQTIKGKIWYETGLTKLEHHKEKEALVLLKRFTKEFNGSKDAAHAESMIEEIRQGLAFHKSRIGILLPLSGYFQQAGLRCLNAIRMAVKEWNAANGGDFKLLVRNSESSDSTARKAVKELKKRGASCIIGPMVTAQSAAVEANRLKLPIMLLSQKKDVPKKGKYIFRNFLTPEMQIKAMVSYVTEILGYHRFAVLYPDEKYGRVFQESFTKIAENLDAVIVEKQSYKPGQTDFAPQIQSFIKGYQKLDSNRTFVDLEDKEKREKYKIYRAKIGFDALFIPDSPCVVKMIAPQLEFHDIPKILLLGTNLWNSEQFFQMAGTDVTHAIFPVGFTAERQTDKVRQFVLSYKNEFEKPPGYFEAAAYSAAMLMMNCLSNPDVRSAKDVINQMRRVHYSDGITCSASFDFQGEPVKDLDLFRIKGREISLLQACSE